MAKIPQKLEKKNPKFIRTRPLRSSARESRILQQWGEK